MYYKVLALAAALALGSAENQAQSYADHTDARALIDELVAEEGFERESLTALLGGAGFEADVRALLDDVQIPVLLLHRQDDVVVPVALAFRTPLQWPIDRSAVGSALFIGVSRWIASALAFGRLIASAPAFPLAYLPFPFIFWASLRFGAHGAAFASSFTALYAIRGTLAGFGPFARASPTA